jgi:hypothetical protein
MWKKIDFEKLSNLELILFKIILILLSALMLTKFVIAEIKSLIHAFG